MPAYVLARSFTNQAICSCGWQGKKRLLKSAAVVDVYLHCAVSEHLPAGTSALLPH